MMECYNKAEKDNRFGISPGNVGGNFSTFPNTLKNEFRTLYMNSKWVFIHIKR